MIDHTNSTHKISTCFWFADNANEAVNFYTSVFKNSSIVETSYVGEAGEKVTGMPADHVLTIRFELNGTSFLALNGGRTHPYTPAVSFVVNCDTQGEIDHYWDKLSEGGLIQQCGWLSDKFGITWQIVPTEIGKWISDKKNGNKVMEALLKMTKLEIPILKKAYESI